MLSRIKERYARSPASPVEVMLGNIAALDPHTDDYLQRLQTYLRWARDCGLDSPEAVAACVDLAATLTDIPELTEARQTKQDAWNQARHAALAVEREPRLIRMNLDPIYFKAILDGTKTFEGRAYKHDPAKDYPDIRTADQIRFALNDELPEFDADVARFGLQPDDVMRCTVRDIYFAPTVHGMYQNYEFDGDAFQPMVNGPGEVIQLGRAAVYHGFPGYPELISAHGFLGIQLEDPQLVS